MPIVTRPPGVPAIVDARHWFQRFRELARYAAGSGVMLLVKLLLMQAALLVASPVPAYALVQVFVFLGSYVLHSKVTFGTPFGWGSLGRYLQTMIVFQALDWILFTVIFTRWRIDSSLVILVSTAVVFVLRFVFVRRSLRGGGGHGV